MATLPSWSSKALGKRGLKLQEPYNTIYTYTQVSADRQQNLARLCQILESEGIPGAIVECGVLDGGTAGLMAYFTAKSNRSVELFDAWKGLPKSTVEDGPEGKKWESQVVGSPRCVVHYHTGWFHETFPKVELGEIALLHVDCDFYDPVKLTLETWYPKVIFGGFVQLDDYGSFEGCRKATDDFLIAHPELTLETNGTYAPAYFFRKP
jgi:O-methyltransferase